MRCKNGLNLLRIKFKHSTQLVAVVVHIYPPIIWSTHFTQGRRKQIVLPTSLLNSLNGDQESIKIGMWIVACQIFHKKKLKKKLFSRLTRN